MAVVVLQRVKASRAFKEMDKKSITDFVREWNGGSLTGIRRIAVRVVESRMEGGRMIFDGRERTIWPLYSPKVIGKGERVDVPGVPAGMMVIVYRQP